METQFDVASEIMKILNKYQQNKINRKDVAIIISGLIEFYAEDKIKKTANRIKSRGNSTRGKISSFNGEM